jgi:PAS domain S-box-containing protein
MASADQFRKLRYRLAVAWVAGAICVTALLAYTVLQSKKQHEQEVALQVDNLATLLNARVSDAVEKVDLTLQSVTDQLQDEIRLRQRLRHPRVDMIIERSSNRINHVAEFRITDSDGILKFGPGFDEAKPVSYADRVFFDEQKTAQNPHLVVSLPLMGRTTKKWNIIFSRPYFNADGKFAGLVLAALPVSYFEKTLAGLDLGRSGGAVLRDANGGMIARFPSRKTPENEIGSKNYSKEFGQAIHSGEIKSIFKTANFSDNIVRITSYRRIESGPFHLAVGLTSDDYLAQWYEEIYVATVIDLLIIGIITLFTRSLWGSLSESEKNRRQIENSFAERNEAMSQLSDQTRLLNEIIECLPYGVVVFDAQGNSRVKNSKFSEILSLQGDSFAKTSFNFFDFVKFRFDRGDYLGLGSLDDLMRFFSSALKSQRAITRSRMLANGTHIEFRTIPILNGWTILSYFDITEKEKQKLILEKFRERVQLATESAGIGIWEYDFVSQELIWDAQQCRLHGLPAENITGNYHTWAQKVHPDDRKEATKLLRQAIETGNDFVAEFRVIWADGTVRKLRALGRMRYDDKGQIIRAVGTNLDITEATEQSELLKAALAKSEEASQSKGRFLASMSHEIRTPMNAILGLLRLMQNTDLTRRQNDYVLKASGAARSLLSLLNDVLDFSKVEAGKMSIENRPFELDDLLQGLSVILSANVGNKPIEILYDIDAAVPTRVVGDSLRLQQVLINLCGNAIKFTERGHVVLALKSIQRAPDAVSIEFSVQDSGIGISAEHIEYIFSGFSQAEGSTTRRFGGSGLGLAISKRLVELMGGSIALSSSVGVGSRFSFTLDFAVPAGEPRAPSHLLGRRRYEPPSRVLIFDDNLTSGALTQRMTQALSWPSDLADSESEVLQAINDHRATNATKHPYALAIIKWRGAGTLAKVVLRSIREQAQLHAWPPCQVLIVVAEGPEYFENQADQLEGVDAHLQNPFTASMLEEKWLLIQHSSASLTSTIQSDRPAAQRLQGMSVLLVEDNLLNQKVAGELLSAEGAIVSVANNGKDCVDALNASRVPFDVVLMDVEMPVMDGFSATREIRESLGLKDLPIMAMTANTSGSDEAACIAAGMNSHIGKPFEINQLVHELIRLCRVVPGVAATVSHGAGLPLASVPPGGGLNLANALARMGNMSDLYVRAAMDFRAELSTLWGDFQHALEDGDRQALLRRLHTVKGNAATLGLESLARMANEVEKHLRAESSISANLLDSALWAHEIENSMALLDAAASDLAQSQRKGEVDLSQAPMRAQLDQAAPFHPRDSDATSDKDRRLQALIEMQRMAMEGDLAVLQRYAEWQDFLEGLPAALNERLARAMQNLDLQTSHEVLCAMINLARSSDPVTQGAA